MKKKSFFRNIVINNQCLICILVLVQLSGCYSFTGGSIPEHLKTLNIAPINDNSGFGDPRIRETLTQLLVNKFRSDHSYNLVDRNSDARLNVVISSIRDTIMTVSPGQVEAERKATVQCDVEYFDAVKKLMIFKKGFSAFGVYPSASATTDRIIAINKALEQVSDDILLAVVSGW
ncbi:MAG: LPS assembly lipoprotein LptE [FCB group bacterium]|jgi:hypothetical protein